MNSPMRTALLAAVSVLSLAACESGPTKAQLATANATIAEKTAQIATLQGQVAALTGNISALDTQVADLTAQLATSTAENAELSAQVAELTARRDALTAELATLQSNFDALSANNSALTTQLATTEAALAAAQGQIGALTDDLAALQTAYDTYSQTAFNNAMDRTEYRRTVTTSQADVTAAQAAYDSAVAAAAAAAADLSAAQGLVTGWPGDVEGQTLSTFIALHPTQAALYAEILGLDVTNPTDQATPVGVGLLTAPIAALATASTAAADAATTANTTLSSTTVAYQGQFGGYETSGQTRLYRADGRAIDAYGAAFYGHPDATANGEPLPVKARLTALFLLDDEGTPVEMLVWDAAGSPFVQQPVGDAVFQSDSMVAFFAQQEGNSYVLQSQASDNTENVGSLTLDFGAGTGALVLDGITNKGNQDYAIAATLTFDPVTGQFTGSGNQSYTTGGGTGAAEVAAATIEGGLWGDAEAFTALINATDVTAGSVPVTILTAIGGTGGTVTP